MIATLLVVMCTNKLHYKFVTSIWNLLIILDGNFKFKNKFNTVWGILCTWIIITLNFFESKQKPNYTENVYLTKY